MGYRSQVVAAVKGPINTLIKAFFDDYPDHAAGFAQVIKTYENEITVTEDLFTVEMGGVKWYTKGTLGVAYDEFKDLNALEAFIQFCEEVSSTGTLENTGAFCRIGEEDDDVVYDEWNEGYELVLYNRIAELTV